MTDVSYISLFLTIYRSLFLFSNSSRQATLLHPVDRDLSKRAHQFYCLLEGRKKGVQKAQRQKKKSARKSAQQSASFLSAHLQFFSYIFVPYVHHRCCSFASNLEKTTRRRGRPNYSSSLAQQGEKGKKREQRKGKKSKKKKGKTLVVPGHSTLSLSLPST